MKKINLKAYNVRPSKNCNLWFWNKQARKLQATLVRVRNYYRVTYSLTGVKYRAASLAKNPNESVKSLSMKPPQRSWLSRYKKKCLKKKSLFWVPFYWQSLVIFWNLQGCSEAGLQPWQCTLYIVQPKKHASLLYLVGPVTISDYLFTSSPQTDCDHLIYLGLSGTSSAHLGPSHSDWDHLTPC